VKFLERNRWSGTIGDGARASQFNSAIRAMTPNGSRCRRRFDQSEDTAAEAERADRPPSQSSCWP
jgi:hypothetical protein